MFISATINEITREIKWDKSQVAAVDGDYAVNGFKLTCLGLDPDYNLTTGTWYAVFTAQDGTSHSNPLTVSGGVVTWEFDNNINKGGAGVIKFFLYAVTANTTGKVLKRWDSAITDLRVAGTIDYENPEEEAARESEIDRLAGLVTTLTATAATINDVKTVLSRITNSSPVVVATVADLSGLDTAEYQLAIVRADGYLYYYDGAAWQQGIKYGSYELDTTLTESGKAADAAAVGAEVSAIKEDLYVGRDKTANILLPLAYFSTTGLSAVDFRTDIPENTYTYGRWSLFSASFADTNMPETWKGTDYVSVRKYAITKFANSNVIIVLYNLTTSRKLELIWFKSASTNPYRWIDISNVTNITNQYTYNQYANEYNVTATPSITADTNNYLQPTGDQTDMASAIVAMLTQSGVCNLAPGTFYVSGVDMPDNTAICGCGSATNIILLDSVSDGYAIKMGDNCIVEDVEISGGTSAPTITSTIGTRHGILWQGTATRENTTSAKPIRGTITNCLISNFSGGGIMCYGTGTGINNCLNVSDVYIWSSTVGINISFLSEFHRFTNVHCRGCYYGIINNGGNNTFSNCGFSKNIIGILMDNSSGQSPNNSHGTFSNCVINHSGQSNDGVAIKLLGLTAGEIFTGCNVFFGTIEIDSSQGIVFSACNFKAGTAFTFADSVVVFNGDMFTGAPTSVKTGTNTIVSNACYAKTGEAVTL